MKEEFTNVQNNLPKQSFADDISCFIVFGSNVVNNNTGRIPDDIDVCVVVKNRQADLDGITKYIFSSFKKPDFRIYFQDEIDSNLNFVDVGIGVFAMEYFAAGLTLYGENIFVEKLETVDKEKLKEAYLNKIFEYILRIRVNYFSPNFTPEQKKRHIDKYVLRLSIDILLYREHIVYSDLKTLTKNEIFDLCRQHGIINKYREIDFENIEDIYDLFNEINIGVVKFHSEDKENSKESNREAKLGFH